MSIKELYRKFLEGRLTDGDVVELFRIINDLEEELDAWREEGMI